MSNAVKIKINQPNAVYLTPSSMNDTSWLANTKKSKAESPHGTHNIVKFDRRAYIFHIYIPTLVRIV
jgi:hypothetical protein